MPAVPQEEQRASATSHKTKQGHFGRCARELVISYLFQREMKQRLGNQSTFPTRAAGIEALASAAAHRVLLAESWNAGQRRGCNPETARQAHGPWVPQPALLVTTAAGVPLLASDAACSSTGLVTNCGSSRRKVSSSCK